MRIAYMTLGYPDPGDASSGVFRKVNNQLKTWNKYIFIRGLQSRNAFFGNFT